MTLVKLCLFVCFLSLCAGNYISKNNSREVEVQVPGFVNPSTTAVYEEPSECKWEYWECNNELLQDDPSFKYNCAEVALDYVSCKDSCSSYPSTWCNDNYCVGKALLT